MSSLPTNDIYDLYFAGEITFEELLRTFMFETQSWFTPGAVYWEASEFLAPVEGWTPEEGRQIWESIYGTPPLNFEDNPLWDFVDESITGPVPEGIPDDEDGQNFVERVSTAFRTAFGPLGFGELMPILYPQLFITTFVDPETQELVGETGNFDPGTGEGTMLVPDLDPDLYAVAAACVFFKSPEEFMASWDEARVAAWDYSVACEEEGGEFCFPTSTSSTGWIDWATGGGFGALLAPLLDPRAVGIDFYCILQDDGFCATPPEPVGLIDDDVIDEFDGDEPGIDPPDPGAGAETPDDTGDLVAVQATPSFTG